MLLFWNVLCTRLDAGLCLYSNLLLGSSQKRPYTSARDVSKPGLAGAKSAILHSPDLSAHLLKESGTKGENEQRCQKLMLLTASSVLMVVSAPQSFFSALSAVFRQYRQ